MSYSLQCKDAGVDCPGSFTTETKEELVKHVELHAKEAHPGLQIEPSQIEALIKTGD
jgi:predicted small metal-binding protein